MKNTYILARTWRYVLIVSSVGLVILSILPIFFGNFAGKASDFIRSAIIIGGISGTLTYGIVTSKIITSPEGIETVSFGLRVQATWDKVEKVDINPYGFANLYFKESLYKNKLVNSLLRPLASDRTIQLSPFIDDFASSNLIKDVAKYIPNSNIPEFITEKKSSTKNFQKVGTIGLYYLGFFFLLNLFAFVFRKGIEYMKASGLQNTTLVSYIMITSLTLGLVFNGIGLLGYYAEISKLQDSEISHKARTHYLSPIIALLLGFVGGVIIWAVLQFRSIIVEREEDFALVAFLLGAVSLRASGAIERLFFKDDVL